MSARPDVDEAVVEQAIAWHQALARDDADWDGYLAWLEADPAHRIAFDQIALLDRMVDDRAEQLRELIAVEPVSVPASVETRGTHRRWWLGGTAAAALAGVIAVPMLTMQTPDTIYATEAGQTRTFDLGQGETVQLAPASRLVARAGDPRRLELAAGEAYFAIAHDPNRVMNVKAAGYAVTDIGTRFAVKLAEESITVGVAEGHVSVAPEGGAAQKISAGQQVVGRAGDISDARPVASADVGSWRDGRLIYENAPLRLVAADLSRYSGKKVSVDPAIREREFSGVLSIGDGSKLFENLADLMGISYRMDRDRVRLGAQPAR